MAQLAGAAIEIVQRSHVVLLAHTGEGKMKKKVAELEGAELDYWVAKAAGFTPKIGSHSSCLILEDPSEVGVVLSYDLWRYGSYGYDFSPSTDWRVGGPIIAREGIAIAHFGSECKAAYVNGDGYFASVDFRHSGPTPLIAAMRAYVASKFGGEVGDK